LSAPKRIGIGEICCALLAERQKRGILCDDRKACNWLRDRVAIAIWESIDEVLVSGGVAHHLSEYEVEDCQRLLERSKYKRKYDLRLAVLGGRFSPSS